MNAAKANTDVTQHVVLLERWRGFWGVGGRDARGLTLTPTMVIQWSFIMYENLTAYMYVNMYDV